MTKNCFKAKQKIKKNTHYFIVILKDYLKDYYNSYLKDYYNSYLKDYLKDYYNSYLKDYYNSFSIIHIITLYLVDNIIH